MKVNIQSSRYNYKFETKDSGIIGVYGISGSGKSSLLDAIAGYNDADNDSQGTISYQGKELTGVIKCSYMTQDPVLFPHWTVLQNLQFVQNHCSTVINHDIIKQLQANDLLDKYPQQLSGGEKQRIAFIRALLQIQRNSIVLLDEPFSALDDKLRSVALQILSQQKNCLIYLVTHKISELYDSADEILYVESGSVKYHDTISKAMSSGVVNLPIASKIILDGKAEVIYANDVSIAYEKNPNSSIINQIPVTITAITAKVKTVLLELSIDKENKLFAEITQESLKRLNLKIQQKVIANFKAVAY